MYNEFLTLYTYYNIFALLLHVSIYGDSNEKYFTLVQKTLLYYRKLYFTGSFSDNFNFSMKKASRGYSFCFISKRQVCFQLTECWTNEDQVKFPKIQKKLNKFIFWLFKCLKFLPSRFTVLVTHSIMCIILPLSNIIICFKLSYPW